MVGIAYLLDLLGVGVFAATGALAAARKELDVLGFALVGTVTGIGGGTVRDLLLGRPVFWIAANEYLVTCLVVAAVGFLAVPRIQRRYALLLWADAIGLAVFAAFGARIALEAGASPLVAIVMGVMTATFGGVARDVICNELPLVLHREVYASAAAAGAATLVALDHVGLEPPVPGLAGFAVCLVLRALGISPGLSLPAYRIGNGG